MTTRPSDEEIRAMFARLLDQHTNTSSTCHVDPRQLEELRDMWLSERQAARDGVTDEMVSVTKTDANNYCQILSLLGMEEEGDPVAWVKSTLAIIHERNAKQASRESIAQKVACNVYNQALRDAGYNDEMDDGLSYASPMAMRDALQSVAQPVKVPDVLLFQFENYEWSKEALLQHHSYVQGWNDCREAMLSAAPAYNGKKDD